MQCAGDGDVSRVVSGGLRQRTALAPTCHAAVHEARRAFMAVLGTQPQSLHHAGAIAFQQHIGSGDDVEQAAAVPRAFQVERQAGAAAKQGILLRRHGHPRFACVGRFDEQDLGAHVRQQHARERHRADRSQLDDARTLQGSARLFRTVRHNSRRPPHL
jgi:hypothetical protein